MAGIGTLATIGIAAGIASAGVGIAGAGISFGQAAYPILQPVIE